jgi:hypothetical protein
VVRTLAWPGDEITVQPRPSNYADMHAQLAEVRADVVLAGYGFNESFKGAAGWRSLRTTLQTVIGLLDGPGVVKELDYGTYILLAPEWINACAQAVLRICAAPLGLALIWALNPGRWPGLACIALLAHSAFRPTA